MSWFERFLRLPSGDRSLLVRSVLVLGAARVALWLLPLRVARRLLSRTARPTSPAPIPPDRFGWAHAWVESGGRIVVGELREGLSGYTARPPVPGPRD